jgi:hypothetical protein
MATSGSENFAAGPHHALQEDDGGAMLAAAGPGDEPGAGPAASLTLPLTFPIARG